mmetsp:Transcript_26287/g.41128  ORF Transcript_26287/g.41128 Transcript_26287/m.41128 type:complete len:110 (-) Transcript_26287:160-489(-)
MASAFNKDAMLRLYRNILKLHRRVLPEEMRSLGDSYARSEFKAHKNAKIGFVKEFTKQWKDYCYTLELQATKGEFGKNLDSKKVDTFNDEQKQQLERLESEARKIGGQS